MSIDAKTRLARLSTFLEKDPSNFNLLSEAASIAYEIGEIDRAKEWIDRSATLAPLPGPLLNLKGLIALQEGRAAEAAEIFQRLSDESGSPALRFNLAWSKALLGQYQDALDLLEDDVLSASQTAPSLKIQMMHHLGLYDEALSVGHELAASYPDNQALMGALATLALDAEKADLAKTYAERAPSTAEGSAVLGMLTLGDHDVAGSMPLFENAISQQPQNPRAWIGKGLALLMSGDNDAAADAIDRGAALFGDHLGSWVASGWTHFVRGDYQKARESFERTITTDPNFSEGHGGMAVIELLEGHTEEAKRQTEVALRLDRNCFGAALAKSMLLDRSGHSQMAQKIREAAMSVPAGPNGETIAQALLGFKNRR
jgi:tetratricopeptide (TPR) repeat protein